MRNIVREKYFPTEALDCSPWRHNIGTETGNDTQCSQKSHEGQGKRVYSSEIQRTRSYFMYSLEKLMTFLKVNYQSLI
jgi:hypothetical protein